MELFTDTRFDFMRYRRVFAVVSALLVVVGIAAVFFQERLNLGIDFTGGTQIILQFQEAPSEDELRQELAVLGMADAQIQRYGPVGSGEILIRAPLQEEAEEGTAPQLMAALDGLYNAGREGLDLNQRGTEAITELLMEVDPEEVAAIDEEAARLHYTEIAESILGARRTAGIFTQWEQIRALPQVGPEVAEALQEHAYLGSFSLLGEEVVGPAVGAELRQKGILAVVLSMLAMLAYIWIRFELRFGVGALVAIVHDVIVALGLFAIMGFEFNLTTIAAFLTVVGYSVNDSVVIFDRVRENLRRSRRYSLEDVINLSLNQTLSRTVLTSGTTLLAVGSLFFLGGEILRGFAFVLMVGVVVGTYSTMFVAAPFALFWDRVMGPRAGDETGGKTSALGKPEDEGQGRGQPEREEKKTARPVKPAAAARRRRA
jgi:preprotein translocase subunit SecF